MNRPCDQTGSIRAKLEGNKDKTNKFSKAKGFMASSTTSRQWSGFKNPRIVRVSRTFGGKDRHSKVCTVRGLRDRRIRLSVPTAVQLYDLQDKLGLGQPSKVIDWLLDATKLDIDELPPLRFPPGDFVQFHPQALIGQLANSGAPPAHHHLTSFLDANLTLTKDGPTHPSSIFSAMLPGREGININADLDDDEDNGDNGKSVEANLERIRWNNRSSNGQEDHVTAQSFPPVSRSGAFAPSLMHWDPSGLSSSQLGNHGSLVPYQEPNFRDYSSNHHLFFAPPMAATTSLFHDNRFHPSTASVYPFHPSGSGSKPLVLHELHSVEESNGNQKNKGDSVTEL